MDILTNVIGYLATAVGISIMLPQIVKSWKSGKTGDLSWGMAFLYFANCCLWLIYGLLIASLPMIMANGAGVAISLVQLFLKKKFG